MREPTFLAAAAPAKGDAGRAGSPPGVVSGDMEGAGSWGHQGTAGCAGGVAEEERSPWALGGHHIAQDPPAGIPGWQGL